MSGRVFTSEEDERTINRVILDLSREPLGGSARTMAGLHKWHVLRLALTLSLRAPVTTQGLPDRGARGGAEYRLDQLTGLGKKDEDYTLVTRALLSVLHGVDLFDAERGEERLEQLLEHHLSQGLKLIQARWRVDERFSVFLLRELGEGLPLVAEVEAPQPHDKLRGALAELGVVAELNPEVIHGPRLTRYTARLPRLADLDLLRRGLDKLAFALGYAPGGITLSAVEGGDRQITLDLARPPHQWQRLGGEELRRFCAQVPDGLTLPLCPGVDTMGRPFWFDLSAAAHVLVAGTTGSGKSTAVHSLLCSLLLGPRAADVELVLIDPKQVELAPYRRLPTLWAPPDEVEAPSAADALMVQAGVGHGRLLVEPQAIERALQRLIEEMERRYGLLQIAGVQNIIDLRSTEHAPLKWIVIVVEELADLVLGNMQAQALLVRIAQKGRAAGIHLIVATQRPDAETFLGLLRSNLPTRLALAVQRASESRIILDEEGAERLLKPGDMLYKEAGKPPIRLHGPAVGQATVNEIVRALARGAK
jgi:S-DNA-T family DNA segregation ATPase FtsK/SpoIIIE